MLVITHCCTIIANNTAIFPYIDRESQPVEEVKLVFIPVCCCMSYYGMFGWSMGLLWLVMLCLRSGSRDGSACLCIMFCVCSSSWDGNGLLLVMSFECSPKVDACLWLHVINFILCRHVCMYVYIICLDV